MVPRKNIEICADQDGKYERISCKRYENGQEISSEPEGKKVNCCPFCDAETFSGSWSMETCPDCGATYFGDSWIRDID